MIHDQTKKYAWEGVEFDHHEKTVDWYWGLAIVMVTGIILCIIFKNYLLAVLLALGGALMGFYAKKPHPPIQIEISERGVKIDKDLYLYDNIKSFWMYTDHRKRDRLLFVTSRSVIPERMVTVPDDISPLELRDYLLQFIPEKETRPSFIDLVMDLIRY